MLGEGRWRGYHVHVEHTQRHSANVAQLVGWVLSVDDALASTDPEVRLGKAA